MKTSFLKYAYLIAAVLFLAGAAFFLLSEPGKPEAISSELFQPEKEKLGGILAEIKTFGFAGVPQTRDDSLAAALDLYGETRYKAAQQSLDAYLAAYPDDHTARFYFGMTHLYLEDPERAFKILSPLSELRSFDMQDDARWYAALAASNVDKMRAAGLFSSLSKDTASNYQAAATAVMSSILKKPGDFSFQIESGDAGEMLKCSLVIAARTAWWQAGWVRALIAFLFPVGGAGMVVWRKKMKRLEKEKERSDELLLNILPAETAKELKRYGHSGTRRYEMVTVLFADFQGFTKIAELLPPEELVAALGSCFESYDRIIEKHGLEKIKTTGDCYICAGGLSSKTEDEAVRAVQAAKEILAFLESFNAQQAKDGKPPFQARVGIHTGPLVAGIVGIKKYAYDIWGDTVNIAARMEQNSEGGRINISGSTYELVKNQFPCRYRGKVEAKGKGEVDMYFVE